MTTDTHRAIDAVWRIESAKLIAGLTRIVRDVGLAEDLAQDALVAALEQWPQSGVPTNPGAWLMATAKRRGIDAMRRGAMQDRKHEQVGYELESKRETVVAELDAALDDNVGDDILRLIFMSCHPVLSTEARTALTLRLLGGLTTEEIARAFLVPEATVDRKSTRLNSSHLVISYAVFCLKKTTLTPELREAEDRFRRHILKLVEHSDTKQVPGQAQQRGLFRERVGFLLRLHQHCWNGRDV